MSKGNWAYLHHAGWAIIRELCMAFRSLPGLFVKVILRARVSIETGKVKRREENRGQSQHSSNIKYGYNPTSLSTSVVWLSAQIAERLSIKWGSMECNAMAWAKNHQ
jgi:hypothetical protein